MTGTAQWVNSNQPSMWEHAGVLIINGAHRPDLDVEYSLVSSRRYLIIISLGREIHFQIFCSVSVPARTSRISVPQIWKTKPNETSDTHGVCHRSSAAAATKLCSGQFGHYREVLLLGCVENKHSRQCSWGGVFWHRPTCGTACVPGDRLMMLFKF